MPIQWVFPLLFLYVGMSTQTCRLNSDQVADATHIYAVVENGQRSLLHHDHVPTNAVLQLICLGGATIDVTCQPDGKFSKSLPQARCAKTSKTAVKPTLDANCANLHGQMYAVGYELAGDFLEVYRSCFDRDAVQALYSLHHVYKFGIASPLYVRQQFATDRLITAASRAAHSASKIFERFDALLGAGQTYISSAQDFVIHRGHLAPVNDFVAFDQKDATFKYINVVPQFGITNRGNWKRIETWTKALAQDDAPVTVLTGAYDVLQLAHSQPPHRSVAMFLQDGNRVPIPKWLYKVVRHGGRCTVVVMYNNQFVHDRHNNLPTRLCRKADCPGDLVLNADANSGFAYCCNYSEFVRRIGAHAKLC